VILAPLVSYPKGFIARSYMALACSATSRSIRMRRFCERTCEVHLSASTDLEPEIGSA
jgi:hypothetical protein